MREVRMGGSSYVFTQAALLRRCSFPNHYHRSKWVPEFDNRNPFLPHKSLFSTCHELRSTGHSERQNLCECQTPLLQTKLFRDARDLYCKNSFAKPSKHNNHSKSGTANTPPQGSTKVLTHEVLTIVEDLLLDDLTGTIGTIVPCHICN